MSIDVGYRVLIQHYGYYGSIGKPYVIYELLGDLDLVADHVEGQLEQFKEHAISCDDNSNLANLEHLIITMLNSYLGNSWPCYHKELVGGDLRRLPGKHSLVLPWSNRVTNATIVDWVIEALNKQHDLTMDDTEIEEIVRQRKHSVFLIRLLQLLSSLGVEAYDTEDDSRLLAIGEGKHGIVIRRELDKTVLLYLEPPYPFLDLDEIDDLLWKRIDLQDMIENDLSDKEFVKSLFRIWPRFTNLSFARVSKHLITGTNGKTTTSRMLAHILREARNEQLGLTSTSGIYVDGHASEEGDFTGPWSARRILQYPIDTVVLETARGGLIREGVIFPGVATVTVTNVAADHLGLRDIETVEQMVSLKSTVYQAATKCIVVNVDEDMVYAHFMRLRQDGNVFKPEVSYMGVGADVERLNNFDRFLKIEGGRVIFVTPQIQEVLGNVTEFAFSQHGLITFLNTNAVVALAMAIGEEVPPQVAWKSMISFEASVDKAPGRGNFFQFKDRHFMIDYAHNPHALAQVRTTMTNIMTEYHPKRVLYLPLVAADRREEDLKDYANIISDFPVDIMIFKDMWVDTRGKAEGEIGRMMEQWVRENGVTIPIYQVPNPTESIIKALSLSEPGDLLYICIEKADITYEIIQQFDYDN